MTKGGTPAAACLGRAAVAVEVPRHGVEPLRVAEVRGRAAEVRRCRPAEWEGQQQRPEQQQGQRWPGEGGGGAGRGGGGTQGAAPAQAPPALRARADNSPETNNSGRTLTGHHLEDILKTSFL